MGYGLFIILGMGDSVYMYSVWVMGNSVHSVWIMDYMYLVYSVWVMGNGLFSLLSMGYGQWTI